MKHKHWLSEMDRLGCVDAAITKKEIKKASSELTTTQIVAHPELGMSRCHLRFETLLFAFLLLLLRIRNQLIKLENGRYICVKVDRFAYQVVRGDPDTSFFLFAFVMLHIYRLNVKASQRLRSTFSSDAQNGSEEGKRGGGEGGGVGVEQLFKVFEGRMNDREVFKEEPSLLDGVTESLIAGGLIYEEKPSESLIYMDTVLRSAC